MCYHIYGKSKNSCNACASTIENELVPDERIVVCSQTPIVSYGARVEQLQLVYRAIQENLTITNNKFFVDGLH